MSQKSGHLLDRTRAAKLLARILDGTTFQGLDNEGAVPPEAIVALRKLKEAISATGIHPGSLVIREPYSDEEKDVALAPEKLRYVLRRMPKSMAQEYKKHWNLIDRNDDLDEIIGQKYGRKKKGLPPYAKEWVLKTVNVQATEWYRWRKRHHEIPLEVLDKLRGVPDIQHVRSRWTEKEAATAYRMLSDGKRAYEIERKLRRAPGSLRAMLHRGRFKPQPEGQRRTRSVNEAA